MNEEIQEFARSTLKEGLADPAITDSNRELFKKMYGQPYDPDLDVDEVVDAMPAGVLDLAMEQVRRTIEKHAQEKVDSGYCHADSDGLCEWDGCPQGRDGESLKPGHHFPLDCPLASPRSLG